MLTDLTPPSAVESPAFGDGKERPPVSIVVLKLLFSAESELSELVRGDSTSTGQLTGAYNLSSLFPLASELKSGILTRKPTVFIST